MLFACQKSESTTFALSVDRQFYCNRTVDLTFTGPSILLLNAKMY